MLEVVDPSSVLLNNFRYYSANQLNLLCLVCDYNVMINPDEKRALHFHNKIKCYVIDLILRLYSTRIISWWNLKILEIIPNIASPND